MKLIKRALTLACVALLCDAVVCAAQTDHHLDNYHLVHYTDENGLPQNSVKSIIRDSLSNIWLATEGGLARFNGREFRIFDGFGDSYFSSSLESFHINPGSGEQRSFYAKAFDGSFVCIRNGVAFKDLGAYLASLSKQPFFNPKTEQNLLPQGSPPMFTAFVKADPYMIPFGRNRYFVIAAHQVSRYEQGRQTGSTTFTKGDIWGYFRIGNRLYWHGDGNQFYLLDLAKARSGAGKVSVRGDITRVQKQGINSRIQLFWNNASDQAFLRAGQSLYRLFADVDGGLNTQLILSGFDFEKNVIKSVYYQQDQNRLFLGSTVSGLYVLKKKIFRTYVSEDPRTDDVYYAQVALNDSTVLSNQGGVFALDAIRHQMRISQMPLLARLADWDKYSVIRDRKGFIWCKNGYRIFKLDAAGTTLLRTYDSKGRVTQLYEAKDGTIWVGSRDQGIGRINPGDQSSSVAIFLDSSLKDISWIQENHAGLMLVGTGSGLYEVSLHARKAAFITATKGLHIRSLYLSAKDSQIWITTYNSGLFMLEGRKLTRFPMDSKRYLASAHCIVEDSKGFFWIPTNKGLFQIRKADLIAYSVRRFEIYYHHYARDAGFLSNEFNGGCQKCAVRLKNGYVSLPSMEGLVWFQPEKTTAETSDEKVTLDEVRIDNKKLDFNADTVVVENPSSSVFFKFTTAYFGRRENLTMSYSLGGPADTQTWTPLSAGMELNIAKLASGTHTLSVRKHRGFGVNNFVYSTVTIVVGKHWYESWLFIGVIVLLTIVMYYVILNSRIKKTQRQKDILKEAVKAKTKHLEDTVGVLRDSEHELEKQGKLYSRMIASISHDVRSPVRYISVVLKRIPELIEKGEVETAIEITQTVSEAADSIFSHVDNMVNFLKSDIYESAIELQQIVLADLIRQRLQSFGHLINFRKSVIHVVIPEELVIVSDPRLLGILIHNLIDNAIKAGDRNSITIRSEQDGPTVKLILSDSGPGFPNSIMQWLNAGSDATETSVPAGYQGLGLMIIMHITKILDVALCAENSMGARVTLTLSAAPKTKNSFQDH